MDLGLSEERFWSMAPVRFFALVDRHEKLERRKDLRCGLLASLLYNPHRGKKKALKPDDFFPDPKKKGKGERRRIIPNKLKQPPKPAPDR